MQLKTKMVKGQPCFTINSLKNIKEWIEDYFKNRKFQYKHYSCVKEYADHIYVSYICVNATVFDCKGFKSFKINHDKTGIIHQTKCSNMCSKINKLFSIYFLYFD